MLATDFMPEASSTSAGLPGGTRHSKDSAELKDLRPKSIAMSTGNGGPGISLVTSSWGLTLQSYTYVVNIV